MELITLRINKYIMTGIICIVISIVSMVSNIQIERSANRYSAEELDRVVEYIEEQELKYNSKEQNVQEKHEEKEDIRVIDQKKEKSEQSLDETYIGYIEIEQLELKLPIRKDWSYKKLNYTPCIHRNNRRG